MRIFLTLSTLAIVASSGCTTEERTPPPETRTEPGTDPSAATAAAPQPIEDTVPGSQQSDTVAETPPAAPPPPNIPAAPAEPLEPFDFDAPLSWPEAPQPPVRYRERPEAEEVGPASLRQLLADLAAAPTAAEWRAWQRSDEVDLEVFWPDRMGDVYGPFGSHGNWCLRSTITDTLDDEHEGTILAYFYLTDGPTPPVDLTVPPLSRDGDFGLHNCRLGLVVTETTDSTAVGAARGAFDEWLGSPETLGARELPGRLGFGLLREGTVDRWNDDTMSLGVASRPSGTSAVFAYTPVQASSYVPSRNAYSGTRAWYATAMDLAMRAGGVDSTLAAQVRSLRAIRPDFDGRPEAELVEALQSLVGQRIEADEPLEDRTRYAARLVAADLLVEITLPMAGGSMDRDVVAEAAAPLSELGIHHVSEMRINDFGTWHLRSLLDSALVVNPEPGGWGDLGRTTRYDDFCEVRLPLEATRELLPRVTQPHFRARLHYLHAEALADLVSPAGAGRLRAGVVDDIEQVRVEALVHYQLAIDGALDPTDKLRAWSIAFAVAANLYSDPRCDRFIA